MMKEIYVVVWHTEDIDEDEMTVIRQYHVEEMVFKTLEAAQDYALKKSLEHDHFQPEIDYSQPDFATRKVTRWTLARNYRKFAIIRTTVQEEEGS